MVPIRVFPVVPIMSFRGTRASPGSQIDLVIVLVTLVSVWNSSSISPGFHDLDILMNTKQLLCRMCLNLGLSGVPFCVDLGPAFVAGIPQTHHCVLHSAADQEAHDTAFSHH